MVTCTKLDATFAADVMKADYHVPARCGPNKSCEQDENVKLNLERLWKGCFCTKADVFNFYYQFIHWRDDSKPFESPKLFFFINEGCL